MRSVQAVLAILVLMPAAGAALASADLVLLGGKVVTVDDQFSVQEAVAVTGRRVVAVGPSDQMREHIGPETRVIELQGRTVVPGLIDTHSHIMRASQLWKYEVRLDGVTSRAKALAKLRRRAETLGEGEWLLNFGGWVEEQFVDDPRGFSLDELDELAPENPVLLDVNYNHRYVNSRFLELADVSVAGAGDSSAQAATTDADGLFTEKQGLSEAMIERDASGRATGRIGGGAAGFARIIPLLPRLQEDDAQESLRMIVDDALAKGLTAVYDGGGFGIRDADYARAQEMAAEGTLKMRVFHSKFVTADTPDAAARAAAEIAALRPFTGGDYYDLIGVGESVYVPALDGFSAPAADTEQTRGALSTILGAAARGGWNVQQHMVQPATMHMVLDVVDELAKTHSIKPLRWIVIHADLLDRPTIDRMRRYHMTPSLRTHFMLGSVRRTEVAELFGEDASLIPPLRMVQDTGINWAFGSEAPRINVLNPLMSLAFAVTGKRFYDLKPVLESTVTREEALIAHTRNAAWQIFRDNDLGQIRPGFLADMVVLDGDYLTLPAEELYGILPLMTFVGGELVYAGDEEL